MGAASATMVLKRRTTSPAINVRRPFTSSLRALKVSSFCGQGSWRAVASKAQFTIALLKVSIDSKSRESPGTVAACICTRPKSRTVRSTKRTCSFKTKRKRRKSPRRCSRFASFGSSKTSIAHTSPLSTKAGCPIKVCPLRLISINSGNSPKVQSVTASSRSETTVASCAATALKVSCACSPNSARSCARLRPIASCRPCSSTTLKFITKCAGSCSSLKSLVVQGTPVCSRMSAASTSKKPLGCASPSSVLRKNCCA